MAAAQNAAAIANNRESTPSSPEAPSNQIERLEEPEVQPDTSRAPDRSSARRFGIALLSVLAVLAVRLAFAPALGTASPFLLFVPAVIIAARYGGVWPGLFATLLSSILGSHYLAVPASEPAVERWDRVGLFVVVSVVITWVEARLAAASERVKSSLARERDARLEAQAANRAKDDFLAMVSHELRTPATTVLGWLSMLRAEPPDSPTFAKGLTVIERNLALQSRLLDDIVDHVRTAKGTMPLRRQAVDLTSVITAAVDTARPTAASRGVALHERVEGPGIRVLGDPVRLQQVMTNLISNGLKFTPAGGSVMVRAETFAGRARLTVSDTGLGIDPTFLPHVFERFTRGDHGREGLGLGLAICRHLVEMHGGTIEVASAGPARGTTFTVTLPLLPGEGSTVAPPAGGRNADESVDSRTSVTKSSCAE